MIMRTYYEAVPQDDNTYTVEQVDVHYLETLNLEYRQYKVLYENIDQAQASLLETNLNSAEFYRVVH